MALQTYIPNLSDACRPVGLKNKSEQLGHEIIEFAALVGVCELAAVGTTGIAIVGTTATHLAPGCRLVVLATRAFALELFIAGSAVQSTISDHLRVRHNLLHDNPLPYQNDE